MGFQKIEKRLGAAAMESAVRIVIGRSQTRVSISGDILEALGMPRHFDVFVGDGADAGTMLLAPTPDEHSYKVSGKSGRARSITLPTKQLGNITETASIDAAFEMAPDGLMVHLPRAEAPRKTPIRASIPRQFIPA